MINNKQKDWRNIAVKWDDAHKYSPAPRHRRRIILKRLQKVTFQSCLDVGCAQPYLLKSLSQRGKTVFGCDISDKVISFNRNKFPNIKFEEVDISKEVYPNEEKFDVVISSELLEHIENWKVAVKNLCVMADKYLLITVPSGRIHKIDRIVGHIRHYQGYELADEIKKYGFYVVLFKRWGFPFHTIYKYLINLTDPEKVYESFATGSYSITKKLFSQFLYCLFYLNDIFGFGSQLFILAERKG